MNKNYNILEKPDLYSPQLILKGINNWIYELIDTNMANGGGAYFITINPKRKAKLYSAITHSQIEYILNQFGIYHYHLMCALDANPTRNLYKAPVSIAFADVDGTKKNTPNYYITPHLHAIVLTHPKSLGRFSKLQATGFKEILTDSKLDWIGSQQFDPILHTPADIQRVSSYCTKALVDMSRHLKVDPANCMMPYPKDRSELTGKSSPQRTKRIEDGSIISAC